MSYNYNIIRSGYTIPLTSVFAGYNSAGTTTYFTNMGSFTSAVSNYRKQNAVGYQQNGYDIGNIYEAKKLEWSAGLTVYLPIPNGCSAIRILLIGGGGGGGGGSGISFGLSQPGGGGGGGACLCADVAVSSGSSASLYVGYGGGGGSSSNNGGNGEATVFTFGSNTWSAGGGIGGSNGNATFYYGGLGGTNTVVSGTGGTYYYNRYGDDGVGNTAGRPDAFHSYSSGNSSGGYSGIYYASTTNFDTPVANVGNGGSSTNTYGNNGYNGYAVLHYLY
jgi:hypothetical protein